MRQAGRYHRHYQQLRARHEFIELCKNPALACEVTLGPIEDFGFDAAILFSDLLFPLEALGLGLEYSPAPKLGWYLRATADLSKLTGGADRAAHMQFQSEALQLLRRRLPADRGLIGFVGGPFTLYAYATAGSHEGFTRQGLHGLGLQCLGVDWHHDLAVTLRAETSRWAVQGNLDPEWLQLPAAELERRAREVWQAVRALPAPLRAAWVCGLGHGVLQHTPEDNVRLLVRLQREIFEP